MGLGKFAGHRKLYGMSLGEYSVTHADYMTYYTNYKTYGECLSLAKTHHLRASFRYTRNITGVDSEGC
jgi:hypothetical protein